MCYNINKISHKLWISKHYGGVIMTRKILSMLLAVMLVLSCTAFAVAADEELAYYVEAGATGKGTEDDPFGTLEEAISAIGDKDGTIYVYGVYNISTFKAPAAWKGMITITGVTSDALFQIDKSKGIVFPGDVTIKDILFDVGEFAHINNKGTKLIYDAGEDSNFKHMIHLPALGNAVVDESYAEFRSGKIGRLHIAGAYVTSYANGIMGDDTVIIDGAEVSQISLQADAYMDTHTGISVGGNINIVVNSGTVKSITTLENRAPEVMGSLNIIFNNGVEPAGKIEYTEDKIGEGVYIITSDVGGKIMPTADPGVFEVISDSETKVAKIDGQLVYNGKVELEPGEIAVEWVAGQQPEKPVEEEKTEIKLTIGKAEITTNGEAKALDVPAQIIDSRTMVPLRAIFEALGASVEWDDATKTVTSVKGETTVKLTIGQASINVNGEDKALDVPAQIVDSRTLVPVRAIAESFGCDVAWDDPTKTVTITK